MCYLKMNQNKKLKGYKFRVREKTNKNNAQETSKSTTANLKHTKMEQLICLEKNMVKNMLLTD